MTERKRDFAEEKGWEKVKNEIEDSAKRGGGEISKSVVSNKLKS